MEIPEQAFVTSFRVVDADIDARGHVNNVVHLRWVQEAAERHWALLSEGSGHEGAVWIVRRHEVDYLRPILPDGLVEAHTWVGETSGPRSVRHVVFLDGAGRVLAEARTTWCMVDPVSHRPVRIPETVVRLLTGDAGR